MTDLISDMSAEDAKLVTLARTSRARNQARQGAAVRDQDGRTYVATTVQLPSLQLTALQVAVAMAVASGATSLEAAVVVGESDSEASRDPHGVAAATDLKVGTVLVADPSGALIAEIS